MPSVPPTPSFPVRLDLANECLWRGAQAVPLRPKTFAVLRYLVEHHGQLVTKTALLDAVWPEIAVSDGGLMVCLHELRRALGDDAKTPRFIETVHRRGYRLIGPITVMHHPPPQPPPSAVLSPVAPVGREVEMAYLHQRLEQALSGVRQLVFVTGEAGVGKTTLVDAFVEGISHDRRLWIGRGQCIEHYGLGEAYLPVLEAFGQLCLGASGQELVRCLARHAPTWLVQMPWLVSPGDLEALQRQVLGATRERMLRELAQAIDVLTDAQPLVLVLEDLHWSDYSTLDLLAILARRREPARLLLLGTYRPEDVLRQGHPLHTVQRELQMHGHCTTLPLTFLTEDAIAAYLTTRLPGLPMAVKLARFVHRHTDGNPLFMVNVIEAWLAQGVLVEQRGQWALPAGFEALSAGVPENVQQMIEQKLDRLNPAEQRIVEAASIAGVEFSAAAVAAGIAQEAMQVEACCADLARRGQLLRLSGERTWPDGTIAGFYSFIHALYQEVVYHRIPAAQRLHLHRRVGERLEAGYGAQAGDIAAELAIHFECGRDTQRAVTYLQHAADNAIRRYANTEAISHLSNGIALLKTEPDRPERTQRELQLQSALGAALTATKGFAASDVERVYARAYELCRQVGEAPQLFVALWGLLQFYLVRAELQTARELGERLLSLAQSGPDQDHLLAAHNGLGTVLSYRAELGAAREHLEQSIAPDDPPRHRLRSFVYGTNLKADSLAHLAHVLWLLGYPEQALRRSQEALTLAQEPFHPFSLAHVANFAAVVHHLGGEGQQAQERAEAGIMLASEHGFAQELGRGTILQGWALVLQGDTDEGLRSMGQGLASYQATGAEAWRPYYLALLAEARAKEGQVTEGLRLLTEALGLAASRSESWWAAELHRLMGELLLMRPDGRGGLRIAPAEAGPEACFHQALALARRQQAKSLELRAAMSLSRLWQEQDKCDAARALLAEVYGWFTEGFDTADLRQARTLLAELSNSPIA